MTANKAHLVTVPMSGRQAPANTRRGSSKGPTRLIKYRDSVPAVRAHLVDRAHSGKGRQAGVCGQQVRQQREAHALGGGVHKQDARAQPLALAERCLPACGRRALRARQDSSEPGGSCLHYQTQGRMRQLHALGHRSTAGTSDFLRWHASDRRGITMLCCPCCALNR